MVTIIHLLSMIICGLVALPLLDIVVAFLIIRWLIGLFRKDSKKKTKKKAKKA